MLHKDFPLITTAAFTPALWNIESSLYHFGCGPQLSGQCPCFRDTVGEGIENMK